MKLKRSGLFGSINQAARHELKRQTNTNLTIRGARGSIVKQIHFAIMGQINIRRMILGYILINITVLATEVAASSHLSHLIPSWSQSGPPGPDIKNIILSTSGYVLAAQVGMFGLISIAIALVSILFQNEESERDVEMYYAESLSYQVFASGFALTLVLVVQLYWPAQFFIHKAGYGTELQFFKLILCGVHLIWFAFNLLALAHFATQTLDFVRVRQREAMRYHYLATVIVPNRIEELIRGHLLSNLNNLEGMPRFRAESAVTFGYSYGHPQIAELQMRDRRDRIITDIWIAPLRLAVHSWMRRIDVEALPTDVLGAPEYPQLNFPNRIDDTLRQGDVICYRMGGPNLTRLERLLIRLSIRTKQWRPDV